LRANFTEQRELAKINVKELADDLEFEKEMEELNRT
jgi:hypothetical protein